MLKRLLEKLTKSIAKKRVKLTFQSSGYEIKTFNIQIYGQIKYAQWKHSCETQKILTDSTIQFYESYIPKNSFTIDIGAHTGDTTVPMAICCRS